MSVSTVVPLQRLEAPALAINVGDLRHRVAKMLADWGAADLTEQVLLACTELLTNALNHGRTDTLVLDLSLIEGYLRVTVPDGNPAPPYLTVAEQDAENGRGVLLIAALADAWGLRATADGKTVFAEFQLGAGFRMVSEPRVRPRRRFWRTRCPR